MAQISFTANIQRHVVCPTLDVAGSCVRDVLEAAFSENEQARSYVLDEHGALHRHMNIFVDGEPVRDRTHLSDTVSPASKVYVIQALSGG